MDLVDLQELPPLISNAVVVVVVVVTEELISRVNIPNEKSGKQLILVVVI